MGCKQIVQSSQDGTTIGEEILKASAMRSPDRALDLVGESMNLGSNERCA